METEAMEKLKEKLRDMSNMLRHINWAAEEAKSLGISNLESALLSCQKIADEWTRTQLKMPKEN